MPAGAPVRFLPHQRTRAAARWPHGRSVPMLGAGKSLGVLLGGVVTAGALAPATAAPPPALAPAAPASAMPAPSFPNTAGAVRVNLADVVHADYRETVMRVVKQPTVS